MLGRNHGAGGVIAWGAGLWVGTTALAEPHLPVLPIAIGTLVAAGSALAPDLDESHSLPSQSNPIAKLPIFGGHRTRTHTVLAVVLVALAAVWCSHSAEASGVLAGFMASMGAAWALARQRHVGLLTGIGAGCAIGWVTATYVQPGWWLVAATALPYLSHLLGDWLTPGGVPLLMPATRHKWSAGLFRTGGAVELLVMTPLLLIAAIGAMWVGVQAAMLPVTHLPHL